MLCGKNFILKLMKYKKYKLRGKTDYIKKGRHKRYRKNVEC